MKLNVRMASAVCVDLRADRLYGLYASAQNGIKMLHQNKAKVSMAITSRKTYILFLKNVKCLQ
jgi:hypothetical protein